MAKNLPLLFAAIFFSCAKVAKAPEPGTTACQAPPQQYLNGRLVECKKNDQYFACALEFEGPDGRLCAHLVAQPANDCTAPWQYVGVVCADAPPAIKPKASTYDPMYDEGTYEAI